jgi:hypothetical protein
MPLLRAAVFGLSENSSAQFQTAVAKIVKIRVSKPEEP